MARISCLLPTYGRFRKVCEAVACFLLQDYRDKELVILNNHPIPLHCDQPGVSVINDATHRTLGDCRNALLQHATGSICCCWNDDDVYLPWHLTECVTMIASNLAYAPMKFWHLDMGGANGATIDASTTSGASGKATLNVGPMLGGMAFRTDFLKRRCFSRAAGDEHAAVYNELTQIQGGLSQNDPGLWASYCRCWNDGGYHISGTLGRGKVGERVELWYRMNQDFRPGTALVPARIDVQVNAVAAALGTNKTVQTQWQQRVDRALKGQELQDVEPCKKVVVQEPLLPQPQHCQRTVAAPARPVIRTRRRQAVRSTVVITTPPPQRLVDTA